MGECLWCNNYFSSGFDYEENNKRGKTRFCSEKCMTEYQRQHPNDMPDSKKQKILQQQLKIKWQESEENMKSNLENGRRLVFVAMILNFFLGYFGIHWFYLGHKEKGKRYLKSFGYIGFGWIIDMFYLPILFFKYKEYKKPAVRITLAVFAGLFVFMLIISGISVCFRSQNIKKEFSNLKDLNVPDKQIEFITELTNIKKLLGKETNPVQEEKLIDEKVTLLLNNLENKTTVKNWVGVLEGFFLSEDNTLLGFRIRLKGYDLVLTNSQKITPEPTDEFLIKKSSVLFNSFANFKSGDSVIVTANIKEPFKQIKKHITDYKGDIIVNLKEVKKLEQ